MATSGTSTIASELGVPYKNWNRVHLERRVSKPRHNSTIARGHRYNARELQAMEVLRNFSRIIGGSDSEVDCYRKVNSGRLSETHVPLLRVFAKEHGSLTCERCPLILPDMPHYWGAVVVDLDGQLSCSNGCPEPGMRRVRRS